MRKIKVRFNSEVCKEKCDCCGLYFEKYYTSFKSRSHGKKYCDTCKKNHRKEYQNNYNKKRKEGKMKLNNKGFWLLPAAISTGAAVGAYATLGIIALIAGRGLVTTAKDGTLQKNTQVIACKASGKGNDYCDTKYGHLGNGQYAE